MNKAEIYYFSGTGNSLHMARELQKRIPGAKLIPIISLLNKNVIRTAGETVGLVFPVHLATIPIPVKEFLKKLELESAQYVFALATRCGTIHRSFQDIDKVLKKQGKRLDSYFSINMADDNPRFKNWPIPQKEEVERMESAAQNKLDSIQRIITAQEKDRNKDTDYIRTLPAFLIWLIPVLTGLADYLNIHDEFYADVKCTGCGTCERVCLSRKIQMINNRPGWQKNVTCYSCRACLNFCPVQAVQLQRSHSAENGRYDHPYGTPSEIAAQK